MSRNEQFVKEYLLNHSIFPDWR